MNSHRCGTLACVVRCFARRAIVSSENSSIPPPPVVIVLLPLKLNAPIGAMVPVWRPW